MSEGRAQDTDVSGQQDRIEQYLPPEDLPTLKTKLSNDELWLIASLRQIKEHGFGQLTASISDGDVVQLDTTERRRNIGELALSMS